MWCFVFFLLLFFLGNVKNVFDVKDSRSVKEKRKMYTDVQQN